eukprot:scaffold301_cov243-Pinguiococcus_pyrenoidosus.AAC.45
MSICRERPEALVGNPVVPAEPPQIVVPARVFVEAVLQDARLDASGLVEAAEESQVVAVAHAQPADDPFFHVVFQRAPGRQGVFQRPKRRMKHQGIDVLQA